MVKMVKIIFSGQSKEIKFKIKYVYSKRVLNYSCRFQESLENRLPKGLRKCHLKAKLYGWNCLWSNGTGHVRELTHGLGDEDTQSLHKSKYKNTSLNHDRLYHSCNNSNTNTVAFGRGFDFEPKM